MTSIAAANVSAGHATMAGRRALPVVLHEDRPGSPGVQQFRETDREARSLGAAVANDETETHRTRLCHDRACIGTWQQLESTFTSHGPGV
jgi:hypothetical protein